MQIKTYCRYCLEQTYMIEGKNATEAVKLAAKRLPDQLGNVDAACVVVTEMAQRSGMTTIEYINWCEKQIASPVPL